MTVLRQEYRDGMARLGDAVKVVAKVGLRERSGMRNVASALPAYGMALLGVSLLSLPLFDGAVINFATAVPSATAGSAIALLAVAQCVRPDYFPEYAIVAVSTCEEMLEIDERQFGRPNIVVVYIRNVGLTSPWVQSALELLRVRLPEASTVVLADSDEVAEVNRALTHGVRGYIPTSVEWEVAVAALRLISAGGTLD